MKILLIRRDNIGDLILTTPLIKTLAKHHQVDILVNSYNQDVLENNPHIRRTYLYTKLSHRKKNQSFFKIMTQRIRTILKLRKEKYDVAIIVKEHWHQRALHWAKLSKAKRIIAMGQNMPSCITDPLPDLSDQKTHIVNILNTLAYPLGIHETPGPLELFLSAQEIMQAKNKRVKLINSIQIYPLTAYKLAREECSNAGLLRILFSSLKRFLKSPAKLYYFGPLEILIIKTTQGMMKKPKLLFRPAKI